jgi:hypothetical protein
MIRVEGCSLPLRGSKTPVAETGAGALCAAEKALKKDGDSHFIPQSSTYFSHHHHQADVKDRKFWILLDSHGNLLCPCMGANNPLLSPVAP